MTIDMADDAVANHLGLTYLAPVAKIQIVLKDKKDVAVYVAKLYWPAELVRIDFHNF